MKAKPLQASSDFKRVRMLQQARKAVQRTNLNQHPPILSWVRVSRDGAVANAAALALRMVMNAELPAADLKAKTVAALEAQIAEIAAKYPGITIEED